MNKLFSPYALSQFFKVAALVAIVWIALEIKNSAVAVTAIFIIGTLIASEAFILLLARSLRKEPTDENIVKLFMIIIFRDKDQADKIIDDYKK